MDQKKIDRINELYHKSKQEGLTEEEYNEQHKLRQEYLTAVKKNMRATLDRVSIENPDGTITPLKVIRKRNENH